MFGQKGFIATLILIGVFCVTTLAITPDLSLAQEKKKATKADDLPRHTYPVTNKPSEIIASDEMFNELAGRVKKDILEVLDTFDIEDKSTLQGYYNTLQAILFLEGDYQASFEYMEKARALEEKEAQKLVSGMISRAYVAALDKFSDPMSDAFKAEFQASYEARVAALPWETVQEILERLNGQMQVLGEQLLIGVLNSQMDPAVEAAGFLSGPQAKQIVSFRTALRIVLPCKDQIHAVLGAAIAANTVEKTDIWEARSVTFTGEEGYSPVLVGVWDSGVDVDVFKDSRFTNPKEKKDGKDTDGNGFVDDVHGIAFDLEHKPTPDLLYPLGDQSSRRGDFENRLKGFMDLNAGISSTEADDLRQVMSSLESDQVKDFFEGLSLYANHAHGTHVTGIALEDNPYASVLAARLSFDHHMIPNPFTVDNSKAFGKSMKSATKYFKENNVRVVNMSWGLSLDEIEANLQQNGIGETAEKRAEMAREMFDICKKELHKAIKDAPDVLFIAAAGNSDNDVEFDEFIPSSFDLPNLLVVGAVDKAGEETSFTSQGKTVKVYSNGFEVESYVPGGRRIAMSGTSMSSPNATNLAAKLFARDTSLSPEDVITLITSGAESLGDDKPLMVIHPKRSMELLEKRLVDQSMR